MKSFRPKSDDSDDDNGGSGGRNPERDYHNEKRSLETRQSTTDPDSRLYRKGEGKEAKLCYMGHLLTKNRHGFIVDTELSLATGKAEREAAFGMMVRRATTPSRTLGADKGYDDYGFIQDLRALKVSPHIAAKETSCLDGRTVGTEGYAISQRKRKQIEECFGWMKTVGLMRKLRHRGLAKVGWIFQYTAAAYNIVRLKNMELAG